MVSACPISAQSWGAWLLLSLANISARKFSLLFQIFFSYSVQIQNGDRSAQFLLYLLLLERVVRVVLPQMEFVSDGRWEHQLS